MARRNAPKTLELVRAEKDLADKDPKAQKL
jgi:hypothetical protein